MEGLKKDKKETRDGIRVSYPNGKPPEVFIPVGGFPLAHATEWISDCKNNYAGIRWAKMWTEHVKAQAYDMLVAGIEPAVSEETAKNEEKEEPDNLGLMNGG